MRMRHDARKDDCASAFISGFHFQRCFLFYLLYYFCHHHAIHHTTPAILARSPDHLTRLPMLTDAHYLPTPHSPSMPIDEH